MASAPSLFDFIFKPSAEAHVSELRQGDLLLKTKRLAEAISHGHRHYADNPDYTHFLVLTQSCDLATRNAGICRANYITICAVKPLDAFISNKLTGTFFGDSGPIKIGKTGLKKNAQGVLERLISNTHEEVFFLDEGCAGTISDPSCAFLQLSIALRSEHYAALVGAKQAEMTDVFSAKLGWMAGNLYSRVGTPDIFEMHPREAEAYVGRFTDQILGADDWLSDREFKKFKKAMSEKEASGDVINFASAKQILSQLPDPVTELADAVLNVLTKNRLENDPVRLREIKNRLVSDATLRRFAKSS